MSRDTELCTVHWMGTGSLIEADAALLAGKELQRMSRMRTADDRARFACATVLAKRVIGSELGVDPGSVVIDRRCRACGRDHGRPLAPDTDLFVSLAHAGSVVGVALTRLGPVGLDLEPAADRDLLGLTAEVLGADEHAQTSTDLLRYWVRKESLVKATGDGIGVGLPGVLVSPPDTPPELVAYRGRSALNALMTDLSCRPGYVASVAVLTAEDVRFAERWHHTPSGQPLDYLGQGSNRRGHVDRPHRDREAQ